MSVEEKIDQELNTNEILAQRRAKLDEIREAGIAFPNDFKRDSLSNELHEKYGDKTKEELEELKIEVKVAGRIMLRRLMGKASFVTIQDRGGRIQLYVRQGDIAEGLYEEFKHWDIADIVGASGVLFKTNTNELSIKIKEIRLLTKSLRPLPEKWHGLQDQEIKYRQRYLDLIMNDDARKKFRVRTAIIQGIREFLISKDFLEVETPMMQTIPGGAVARPFETHHNALDMKLFLRIAPELFLKRLIVGGFERVFEINRSFRNEGLSTKHNPEFTMVEFYQAYANFNDFLDLTEELMKKLAIDVLGTTNVTYQGHTFDFAKPFKRMSVEESILEYNKDLTKDDLKNGNKIRAKLKSLGAPITDNWGIGRLQFELFEHTVEDKLMEPTFITNHPTEVSPLARPNDKNPEITDRFEFFVGGRELANAFSELNDPVDQANRFKEQAMSKAAGDIEAMHYDEDYIMALEHGMPPTAGQGIGIDRLVMLFTDSPSIRDVILFPHMKPVQDKSC